MTVWIDAQLSPALAEWLARSFGPKATAVRDRGRRNATDRDIFFAARKASAVVMTKDADFARLLEQHGPPPQVAWLTCGNTSTSRLMRLLADAWPKAAELLHRGEPLVEISGGRP